MFRVRLIWELTHGSNYLLSCTLKVVKPLISRHLSWPLETYIIGSKIFQSVILRLQLISHNIYSEALLWWSNNLMDIWKEKFEDRFGLILLTTGYGHHVFMQLPTPFRPKLHRQCYALQCSTKSSILNACKVKQLIFPPCLSQHP